MIDRQSIDDLLAELDRVCRNYNGYDYGLPVEDEGMRALMRERVREWLATLGLA